MKTPNDWKACYPEMELAWAKRIMAETLHGAAEIADGMRIKCPPTDSEGVVANVRASAIRDQLLKESIRMAAMPNDELSDREK